MVLKKKKKKGGLGLAGDPMGQTAVKGIPSFCCILKLLRYHFDGMSSLMCVKCCTFRSLNLLLLIF
jgi:hypothetical protein